MRNYIYILFLLSSILLLNITLAKKDTDGEELSDNYYIVFLNNTLSLDGNVNRKRSEDATEEIISETIDKIHQLIMKNKSTYKDIEKFEEIEKQETGNLNKRNTSNEKEDSNYVYELATVNERTALYAFLSSELIEDVSNIPNVITCLPRRKFSLTGLFNKNKEIEEETHWKEVSTKKNAPIHLSLISQGHFDKELVGKYDKTYYYPKSAGEDIDIFMFDAGFNFTYKDFSKSKNRIAQCEIIVANGKVSSSPSKESCYNVDYEDHGSQTAAVASGSVNGVAEKANTYGIVVASDNLTIFWENLIGGLQYVKEKLLRKNKAVINFSFGQFFKNGDLDKEDIKMLQELISEISNMGAVFVASAGNLGSEAKDDRQSFIPCVLEDVICVGGISNNMEESQNIRVADLFHPINDAMDSSKYTREFISNYGNGVDIYAPFWVHYTGSLLLNTDLYYTFTEEGWKLKNPIVVNDNFYLIKNIDIINGGTSFSSPIVAGVAATIMSEFPEVKYNTKTMLAHLLEIGEKNIITFVDEPNVFVNNGKRTVYSGNLFYHGCGTYAGNKKCGKNKCCTADGHCQSSSNDLCKISEGCQVKFGKCLE